VRYEMAWVHLQHVVVLDKELAPDIQHIGLYRSKRRAQIVQALGSYPTTTTTTTTTITNNQ
jgi:hypothetical protein